MTSIEAFEVPNVVPDCDVQCAFPNCDQLAIWVTRGHYPCCRIVFLCDAHLEEVVEILKAIIPGWTCVKCHVFTPSTTEEAMNKLRLRP